MRPRVVGISGLAPIRIDGLVEVNPKDAREKGYHWGGGEEEQEACSDTLGKVAT